MRTPLPMGDVWYRVPGDDGKMKTQRAIPAPGFYWALIIDGLPHALAFMDNDGSANAPQLTGDMIRFLRLADRDGEKSIYDAFRAHFDCEQLCRWNNKAVNHKISWPDLPGKPDASKPAFDLDERVVKEAVDKMRPGILRNLREYPVCGRGGKVELCGRADRENQQVIAVWRCDCGE